MNRSETSVPVQRFNIINGLASAQRSRLCHADDTAGHPAAGIADGLRPIVDLLVNDYAPAEDGVFAAEFEQLGFQFQVRLAGAVRLQIAQVPDMMFGRIRSAVRLVCRIVMCARRSGVGRGAIAEFMNVKGMFPGVSPVMSATTCTVSPVFVKVTVPWTWLPDAGFRTAIAFVGS